MSHFYIPFSEDLHLRVWQFLSQPSCLLFDHEGQKKRFVATFQHESSFLSHDYLTVHDYLQWELVPSLPIVPSDQRVLIITQSLSAEHREALSLSSPRSSWAFSKVIYAAWLSAWEVGYRFDETDSVWDEWQQPWVAICREIYERYHQKLMTLGYTDTIFLRPVEAHHKPIVLVNVPVVPLRLKGWDTAFHQGPQEWFNDKTGELRPLSEWTTDVGAIQTQRVREYEVAYEGQEFDIVQSLVPEQVVDPRQRPLWHARTSIAMTRTLLYQF